MYKNKHKLHQIKKKKVYELFTVYVKKTEREPLNFTIHVYIY